MLQGLRYKHFREMLDVVATNCIKSINTKVVLAEIVRNDELFEALEELRSHNDTKDFCGLIIAEAIRTPPSATREA